MINFESLKIKIINQRPTGNFHLELRTFDNISSFNIPASLNSFVTGLGFKDIKDKWIQIDLSAARYLLVKILKEDLAYEAPCMSAEEANSLTEEILSALKVDQNTRFFTNGNFYEGLGNSWYPITEATFDTGMLILNKYTIGLVWVEDED